MPQVLNTNSSSGVIFNVLGSVLFAVLYAYTHLLSTLSGEAIYGWRMLLTVPCLTLFVLVTGRWHEIVSIVRRTCGQWGFALQRLLSSLLLGVQLWLFMWAPINGYGLDVSLGYFLLPITMVIVSRIAFHSRMSRLQFIACGLGVIGAALQIVVAKTISWPALVVCLGYPIYFWLRRVTDTNTLGSTWFDMLLSLPVSLVFVLIFEKGVPEETVNNLPWLILGLGLISASALGCQALSAPRLNLTVFGLLIYVEPVLLVIVSLLLGETIPTSQWPTYLAIWFAVLVLFADGCRALRKSRSGASNI